MTMPLRPGAATSTRNARAGALAPVLEPAPDVPRLAARRALLVGVAVALLQGIGHVLNEVAFDARFWHLDADTDSNALAWFSSALLLTAGLAAYVLGVAARRREQLLLGALLALLALDEIVAWHERVGLLLTEDLLGLPYGRARVVWPAAFLPVLALAFLLLLRVARRVPRPSRRSIVAGLGLLVTAIALEALSALLISEQSDETGTLYAVQVALEEGAELAGWTLVVGGLIGGAFTAVAARFAEEPELRSAGEL